MQCTERLTQLVLNVKQRTFRSDTATPQGDEDPCAGGYERPPRARKWHERKKCVLNRKRRAADLVTVGCEKSFPPAGNELCETCTLGQQQRSGKAGTKGYEEWRKK